MNFSGLSGLLDCWIHTFQITKLLNPRIKWVGWARRVTSGTIGKVEGWDEGFDVPQWDWREEVKLYELPFTTLDNLLLSETSVVNFYGSSNSVAPKSTGVSGFFLLYPRTLFNPHPPDTEHVPLHSKSLYKNNTHASGVCK